MLNSGSLKQQYGDCLICRANSIGYCCGRPISFPANRVKTQRGIFKLLRLFSVISFLCILLTTALLTLSYRQETIRETVHLAQVGNLALAQATLIAVRPELDNFLAIAARVGAQELAVQRLSARITEVLNEVKHDAIVVKVKTYNRRGMVTFATDRDQIGQIQSGNARFRSAVNGRIASSIIYHDTFDPFDGGALDANLMHTYIPVRNAATDSIEGVFEIYTDVTPLVAANERAVFVILSGVGLILLLLYAVLILVVHQARKVIESQQRTISERTTALESLSAEMLRSDEMARKELAAGLHEGLAQTLAAVKVRIENSLDKIAASQSNDASLASMVPALQNAIKEVQAIATGLRPSSLDDLGLLSTIDWFCREFEHLHPEITIEQEISLQEVDTPAPLRIVIYRIVESIFRNIARYENTDKIELELRRSNGAITLEIESTACDSAYAAAEDRGSEFELKVRFAEAHERATLTGGAFSAARNRTGGVTMRASWPV